MCKAADDIGKKLLGSPALAMPLKAKECCRLALCAGNKTCGEGINGAPLKGL